MKRSKTSGFTLLESLVALTILALASVGATVAIANTVSRQAILEQEAAAWSDVVYRLNIGDEGSGTVNLGGGEVPAVWRVSRAPLYTGQLAGVAITWVSVRSEIVWVWKGRENYRALTRTEIEASLASRS